MSTQALLQELQHAARVLDQLGCLPATDGNFSVKLEAGQALLTRSGCEKRALAESDLVKVKIGEEYPAGASSEWLMHRALYRERADVQCVLHVHAPCLNAFAVAQRVPNVLLLAEAALMISEIGFVPFALPGTAALGEAILNTSKTAAVYLLANHGVVAVGKTVRETLHRLERAEFLARVELGANSLGTIQALTNDDVQRMIEAYRARGA